MDIEIIHVKEDECFYVLRQCESFEEDWYVIGKGETSKEALLYAIREISKKHTDMVKAIETGISSLGSDFSLSGKLCISCVETTATPTKNKSDDFCFSSFIKDKDGTFCKLNSMMQIVLEEND